MSDELKMAKDTKQRPNQSPKSTGAGSGKSSSTSGKQPGPPPSQTTTKGPKGK